MGVGNSMEKDLYVLSRNNHFVTAVGSKGAQGISTSCLLSPTVSLCGFSLPEKLLGVHFPLYNVNYRDKTQVVRFFGEHLSLMRCPSDWAVWSIFDWWEALHVLMFVCDPNNFWQSICFCHKMLRFILHVSLSQAWKLVTISRKFPFDDVLNSHCYWPAVVSCLYLVSRTLIFVLIFEF